MNEPSHQQRPREEHKTAESRKHSLSDISRHHAVQQREYRQKKITFDSFNKSVLQTTSALAPATKVERETKCIGKLAKAAKGIGSNRFKGVIFNNS